MPNALELPWMLGAVIPLMRAWDPVVNKLVALTFRHAIRTLQFLRAAPRGVPRFSAVIRAWNDLAEPSTGLGRVNAVRIDWGSFHMINLPARKMRSANLPPFARAICRQDERTLSCTN